MKNTTKFYESLRYYRTALVWAAFSLVLFAFPFGQARAGTFTVSNLDDTGAGSLRQAILDANSSAGADVIDVPSGTINLLTPLPAITDTAAIRGPGSSRTELNGTGTRLTSNSFGFNIQAPNCEIRSFAINRFADGGIRIGYQGSGTMIVQNSIGLNAAENSVYCPDAAHPCGNYNNGILVAGATGVIIGTSGAGGLPNAIAGNLGRGITVTSVTVGSQVFSGSATIQNNFIGTNFGGTAKFGNSLEGILLNTSSGNLVGGALAAANDSNYIVGNGANGILVTAELGYPASNNTIQGNFIGVGTNGSTLANSGSGIVIQSANNLIGGMTANARNVVSGNSVNGVALATTFATGNKIQGNYIGVLNDGTTAALNQANGIQISEKAFNNLIGGTGVTPGMCNAPCNIIANNGSATTQTARAAIYIDATGGTGNSIRANSIYGSAGIGIDLGIASRNAAGSPPSTGSTGNDAKDPDVGANNLQNYPVISAATNGGAINGTINSIPSSSYVIDFFLNTTTDTPAGSEGRTYLGSTGVFTDAAGDGAFSYQSPVALAVGNSISATATKFTGTLDTSELTGGTNVTNGAAAAAGTECDVSPRSPTSGDNMITSTDVAQVRRFSLGLDSYMGNEFQRADCFNKETRGDAKVAVTDVAQATSYQLGFDPAQSVGGPSTAAAFAGTALSGKQTSGRTSLKSAKGLNLTSISKPNLGNAPTITRQVRVVSQSANAGQTITVQLNADTNGDENAYGFTLNFDSTKLVYVANSATIGSGAKRLSTGTNCSLATNPNNAGKVAFSIQCGATDTIVAGTNIQLATLQFTVSNSAPTGSTPLTFGDSPTFRSIASSPSAPGGVMELAAPGTFVNGQVNLAAAGTTRTVRVVDVGTSRNSTVTVHLSADTVGDESIYGFSLNYDTSKLTYVPNSAKIGSGAISQAGGPCDFTPPNTNTAGQFSFQVNCTDSTIVAGNNLDFITLQFTVSNTAVTDKSGAASIVAASSTPITFGDVPTVRSIASNPVAGPVMELATPSTFVNGVVTIAGPTAAGVNVGGKVLATNGRGINRAIVTLQDSNGMIRTVQTNTFGNFNFTNVESGKTYIISANSKVYQFRPQIISVSDSIGNLNLTAESK